MKTLLLSLLLLISPATVLHSQQPNEQREMIKKYKIKKVTTILSIPINSKFVGEYDRRGNLVRLVGYGSNGSPLTQETHKYDCKYPAKTAH